MWQREDTERTIALKTPWRAQLICHKGIDARSKQLLDVCIRTQYVTKTHKYLSTYNLYLLCRCEIRLYNENRMDWRFSEWRPYVHSSISMILVRCSAQWCAGTHIASESLLFYVATITRLLWSSRLWRDRRSKIYRNNVKWNTNKSTALPMRTYPNGEYRLLQTQSQCNKPPKSSLVSQKLV